MRNFVGVLVSFWVVGSCNGETVKVSVFDGHGLSFGNGFIAGVLTRAETFNRERFAGIGVDKHDDNFNSDKIFDVALGGGDLLFTQNVGSDE